MTQTESTGAAVATPPAQIRLFGFNPTPAQVEVIPRATSWRVSHALISLAICWGIMPIVVFIPPHIPWVTLAFAGGIYLAWKYGSERYTLVSLHGTCPKCGTDQVIEKSTKLKLPHRLSCSGCNQNIFTHVDVARLEPQK